MAPKYLRYFPAPLLDDLVKNRWLPFIGAGFSRNSILPAGSTMPMWDQLGRELHKELHDFDYTNALDVLSAYSHEYSRAKLVERLYSALFIDQAKPGPVHQAFSNLQFDVVCTTNFDFLLETQYASIGRPCTPILSESQLSVNVGPGSEQRFSRTTLLKIHGDLNHPEELVATEEDYDDFIAKRPLFSTYVSSLLVARTAVLIGYSLDDSDLRQLWRVIATRLGRLRRPAYAVTVAADPAAIGRYARRGITVINLPGSKSAYGSVLAAAFAELAEYWKANTLPNSTVLREEPLQELSLPPDSASRLCFLGAPGNLLPYLKGILEPIVIEAGFVLVLAQDVVSPGENWLAKIDAIIGKAAIAIVARGSESSDYEVRLAFDRRGMENVLLLESGDNVPLFDLAGFRYIRFGKEIFDDPSELIEATRSWLEARANNLREKTESEPRRLLNMSEYRAALVLAIAGIESEFRSRINYSPDRKKPGPTTRWFFDAALGAEYMTLEEHERLRRLLIVRNRAVHVNGQVNRGDATSAVTLYEKILGRNGAQ